MDLRAPLDPVQVAEALERMRLVLLSKVAEGEIVRRSRAPRSMSSTTCMEMRRMSWLMASGAAMDLPLRALVRSSGRHRQAKAMGTQTGRSCSELQRPRSPRPAGWWSWQAM
jgi:hypothetical protein